jgi:hypothetical protein
VTSSTTICEDRVVIDGHRSRRRTAATATVTILATVTLGGLPATGRGAAGARGRRVVIGRSQLWVLPRVAHMRATCLTFLPGEKTAFNHTLPGTTSFVVELPAGPAGRVALARRLRAVRAVELGERTGPAHRCESSTVAR